MLEESAPGRPMKIGTSIARIRQRRGLTLDGLAELSLVSRATISALERGDGNPRVQTLWSLADALGVNFGTLLGDGPGDAVVEADGVSVKLLERQTAPQIVEAYLLELPADATRQASAHMPGVKEHVVVLSGELRAGPTVSARHLQAGQSMSFAADVAHVYAAGPERCRAIVTVVYPEVAAGEPDHDLPWPASHSDWEDVSSILARATIEVQNGLGVNLLTFRPPAAGLTGAGLDALHSHVSALPQSPTIRRFVTPDPEPAVISLYRSPQMPHLRTPAPARGGALGARCMELAEMAARQTACGDLMALRRRAADHASVIEAALAAEVLTRAGHPTVPFGVSAPVVSSDQATSGGRLFEDRIEVDAYEAYELVHPAYARQALAVAAALPDIEALQILDVGTGPGLPLAMLRELRPDLRAVAVDPRTVAVRHLRRRFGEDAQVEIWQASVTDLETPSAPFDCAVSIGASHHLDTAAFLASIRRQLAPGGRLVVADEMLAPFSSREDRQGALIRHHLWYILDTLVTLPKEAHSGDVTIADRLRAVLPRAQAMAWADRAPAAIRAIRDLYEEVVQIDRPALPSHSGAVFSRFHLLELQALIAGLDYEVEQKTHSARFIALAASCGFNLGSHQRIYATDGDGEFDGGTHLFVLEAF